MRELYSWARDLPNGVFERALLLAGLLPTDMARRPTLPGTHQLRALLVHRWQGLQGQPWRWKLPPNAQQLLQEPAEANRLVEAGEELLSITNRDWQRLGRGLRLEVDATDAPDPFALCDALRRAGAHSAYVRRKTEGELGWSWPLRIGIARTSHLLAGVDPAGSLRPLFQEFFYESAPMQANLLLLEGSLAEATATIARSPRRPPTDAVVVFGGLGDAATSPLPTLSLLSKHTGAQGIFVLIGLEDERRKQVAAELLIVHLSHDQPLDCAVARLAGDLGASALSWATRSLLEATSVREQGRILAERLQKIPDKPVALDADTASKLGVGARKTTGGGALETQPKKKATLSVSAKKLGATLQQQLQPPVETETLAPRPPPPPPRPVQGRPPRKGGPAKSGSKKGATRKGSGGELESWSGTKGPRPSDGQEKATRPTPRLTFDQESSAASTLAKVARNASALLDAEAVRRESRYLQARVETPAGQPVEGQAPLLRAQDYAACVFIGARNAAYLGLDKPFEAPEPPEGSPLLLDVLFWEPTVSPKPQIKQLKLPAQGDSQVVRFRFRTAADQSVFSARIAVYHRNRNLQTGVLRGRVGDGPAALTFTPDAAPVPRFVGLADRTGVGASIIVNDDASGNMQAFVYGDGKAGVAPVPRSEPEVAVDVSPSQAGGLAKLTDVLRRAIEEITKAPEKYSGLSKEGTRVLLRDLAQHGSWLLTILRKKTRMGSLFDQVDRIQVVMAHVDAFLPVEYLYDGEAPEDDAQVCTGPLKAGTPPGQEPQADSQALAAGTCLQDCQKDTRYTICPLRFWSLNKVIERHAYRGEETLDGQFRLISSSAAVNAQDRWLDPLRSAVLAASDKANAQEPKTVENLCQALNAVLRQPVRQASDWKSLAAEVAAAHPTLLVLLPHHEQEGGFDLLEIGGDKRRSMLIRKEHVRWSDDPAERPIVVLMGCQTNAAKVDLEGFVPVFELAGAAIIVSTIASILGRHAGPAAAAIAEELKGQVGNPNATFGDVMLAVRRRLLSQGMPMVLALTSYGDADWRIGAASQNP